MTSFSASEAITYRILRVHELTLGAVTSLGADVMNRRPSPMSPAIGFHLWHMGRGTDRIQSRLGRALGHGAGEIWNVNRLASEWSLDRELLGEGETGMEMDVETASKMQLPEPRVLLDYLKETFLALEKELKGIHDEQLNVSLEDYYRRDTKVGAFLLNHLSHMDRHLGMIEALKGALGLQGSATV